MKIGVLVQARLSSSRLPGKVLLKIGEQTLVQRLYERLTGVLAIPVYFVTSTEASDDPLAAHLTANGIPHFRGSLDNVLQRYLDAAAYFDLEGIVRVTGDNPLCSPWEIQHMLAFAPRCDYIDNIHRDGIVPGAGAEFAKRTALATVPQPNDPYFLEHVTTWLRQHSHNYLAKRYTPQNPALVRNDRFLTCDYPEDLQVLQHLYAAFQYRNDITIEAAVQFLDAHPEVVALHAHWHQPPAF